MLRYSRMLDEMEAVELALRVDGYRSQRCLFAIDLYQHQAEIFLHVASERRVAIVLIVLGRTVSLDRRARATKLESTARGIAYLARVGGHERGRLIIGGVGCVSRSGRRHALLGARRRGRGRALAGARRNSSSGRGSALAGARGSSGSGRGSALVGGRARGHSGSGRGSAL